MTSLLTGAWTRNEVMYCVHNRGSLLRPDLPCASFISKRGWESVNTGVSGFVRLGRSEVCEPCKPVTASRVWAGSEVLPPVMESDQVG